MALNTFKSNYLTPLHFAPSLKLRLYIQRQSAENCVLSTLSTTPT